MGSQTPSHCLICYGGRSQQNTKSDQIFKSDSQSYKQLEVIFVLRNVLEVPRERVSSYLQRLGGSYLPDKWIWTCLECSELINEARKLHEQIVLFSRRVGAVKRRIVERVKDSAAQAKRVKKKDALVDVITNESRSFVLKHDYEIPVCDPFQVGDIKARKLAMKMVKTNKNGVHINTVFETASIPIPVFIKQEDEEVGGGSEWSIGEEARSIDGSQRNTIITDDEYNENMDCDYQEGDTELKLVCEAEEVKVFPAAILDDERVPRGENDNGRDPTDLSYEDKEKKEDRQTNVSAVPVSKKKICERECPLCANFWFDQERKEKLCNHLESCEENANNANEGKGVVCPLCITHISSDKKDLINHLKNMCMGGLRLASENPPETIPLRCRVFECDLCPKNKYFRLEAFLRHYLFHQNNLYKCVQCPRRFTFTNHLNLHWKFLHKNLLDKVQPHDRHTTDYTLPRVSWWCSVCNEQFDSETTRDVHIETVHPESGGTDKLHQYSCKTCSKSYSAEDELKLHTHVSPLCLKKHLELKKKKERTDLKLARPAVGAIRFNFNKKSTLTQRHHHAKDMRECEVCGAQFTDSWKLRRHMNSHQRTTPKDIRRTEKLWMDEGGGGGIRKKHPNCTKMRKPKYSCNKCEKKFFDAWKLRRHEQTHRTGKNKQYHCDLCGKGYSSKNYLMVHQSKSHTKDEREKI